LLSVLEVQQSCRVVSLEPMTSQHRITSIGDTRQQRIARIVHISDTHGRYDALLASIPDGDILVHTGDFDDVTELDYLAKVTNFDRMLGQLPHRHKLYVPGNHEAYMRHLVDSRQVHSLISNATVLVDQQIEVQGIRFYGTPWMDMGGFSASAAHLTRVFAAIPHDIDVLLTHRPPSLVMDLAWTHRDSSTVCGACHVAHRNFYHWGCEAMALEIYVNRTVSRPRLHCFGHVHDAPGLQWHNGVLCSNASWDLAKAACIIDVYPSIAIDARWIVSNDGFIVHCGTALVLDIDCADASHGASVIVWRQLAGQQPQQQWRFDQHNQALVAQAATAIAIPGMVGSGNGYSSIVSLLNHLVLDVSTEHLSVHMAAACGSPTQQWTWNEATLEIANQAGYRLVVRGEQQRLEVEAIA
jgi:Icc-related predicted phosphoesterase